MDFKGYLLKIDGKEFDSNYIRLDSYGSVPNQIMDLDSYRDADGVLHRNPLKHTASIITFETKMLWLEDKIKMQKLLPSSRIKFTLEYWNDEVNAYKTGNFYMPDAEIKIYRIGNSPYGNISPQYKPIQIQFIEF